MYFIFVAPIRPKYEISRSTIYFKRRIGYLTIVKYTIYPHFTFFLKIFNS